MQEEFHRLSRRTAVIENVLKELLGIHSLQTLLRIQFINLFDSEIYDNILKKELLISENVYRSFSVKI